MIRRLALCSALVLPVAAADAGRGWLPPTAEEDAWAAARVVDIVAAPAAPPAGPRAALPATAGDPSLPAAVDNSATRWFPPIRSQGSQGSCVAFHTAYYLMTYTMARELDRDVRGSGDADKMSPSFVYNLGNGGADNGMGLITAVAILADHGVPTWAEWPYGGDPRVWPITAGVWRSALRQRAAGVGRLVLLDSDYGQTQLRWFLANGGIACTAIPVDGLAFAALDDDPATTADDATVGQQVARWSAGSVWNHCVTIVGYDDRVWSDVNGNGRMDAGERGAVKIANSWGTGWGNNGFAWVLADAFRQDSRIPDAPPVDGRRALAFGGYAYTVSPRSGGHAPTLLAEAVVSTANRGQMTMSLGVAAVGATAAPAPWIPQGFRRAGGAFGMDGGGAAAVATLVLDASDLVVSGITSRWVLSVADSAAGSPITWSGFRLTDGTGNPLATVGGTDPAGGLPRTVDAGAARGWVDLSSPPDPADPGVVGDLTIVADAGSGYARLAWTAPGDDGDRGRVVGYEIRRATQPGGAGEPVTVPGLVAQPAGAAQTALVQGLAPRVPLWFAIRAGDDAGRWGPWSAWVPVPWDAPLAVATPAALPGALTGSPWSTILAAAGGQPPYRWQLMPGYTEHAGTDGVLVPGTARDWRSANQAQAWTWTWSQGFRFPMVAPGRQVEAVRVVVRPGGTVAFPDLPGQREIAVFGTALATDGIGEDIFTRETPGRADIRWRAHPVGVTGADGSVEVQLSLFADGDVLMTWGRVAGPAATMQRRVGIRAAPSSVDDVQVIGTWNGTAAIPDGSTARFTALAPPAGIRLDPLTGTISGTPASSGSRAFTVRVTDAAVLAQWADRTFTVATADAGAGPRLGDPAPVVVRVGMAPTFTVAWAGSPAPAIRWESAPPDGPWSTLPGATGPTLVLPAATRDQDGLRVRAVATQGSVTAVSGPARLTVRAAGDADLDGMVDVVDLVHVRRGVITGDTGADLDRDGAVTGADRLPVRQDFTR